MREFSKYNPQSTRGIVMTAQWAEKGIAMPAYNTVPYTKPIERQEKTGEAKAQIRRQHDTIKIMKGGTQMSYVCGLVNRNGVVFCSDSRSSRVIGGEVIEDQRQASVQKVFDMGDYILASFDANEIFTSDIRKVPLAAIIEEKRKRLVRRCDIERSLVDSLSLTFRLDNNLRYGFLIGWCEAEDVYCMRECYITANGIEYGARMTEGLWHMQNDWIAGNRYHVHPNWSVKEMERAGKSMVQSVINLSNTFSFHYSPVGGEIQCVSLS